MEAEAEHRVWQVGASAIAAVGVLLAGYDVSDALAAFIQAEHQLFTVRLFLAADPASGSRPRP